MAQPILEAGQSAQIICVDAWTYCLPVRGFNPDNTLVVKGYEQINFCRGSKDNTFIERKDGYFVEDLLRIVIDRLAKVSQLVPSSDTIEAISKINEGLDCLLCRSQKRIKAGVQGTYKEIPKPEEAVEKPIAD